MGFKRLAIACLIAGAGVSAAVGSATAAAAPPRAELTQYACQHALDPPNRAISVRAVMRPLTGTRKLALKFDLLEGATGSDTPQTIVRGTGLSVWISPPNPTLGQLPGDVWRYSKPVLDLDAPATYQFRVSFRWTGARGRVIGTAVRFSPSCHQRELRPDLLVESITVSPIVGHPEKDEYTAVIANQGATGAGPFEVLFAPGDSSPPIPRTVQLLGADQSRQLSFVGPACDAASPPTVTVDATSEVDDYNRANNTLTAVCPAAPTS
jgi:CARDB